MVLGDFLSETRRRWKKALKLFKRSQQRRVLTSPRHNRVSPSHDVTRYGACAGGAVDASDDIVVEHFCRCAATPPPPPFPRRQRSPDSTYENLSYCTDSAYDTERSSPAASERGGGGGGGANRLSYATVTYCVQDAAGEQDACSVTTELTWLEVEVAEAEAARENAQNVVNEKIEMMTSL